MSLEQCIAVLAAVVSVVGLVVVLVVVGKPWG
jgi:hypothetical protein